jgi:hypothetical protein
MYKAFHKPSRQEIVILDPRWRAQVDYLREFDRQDALVCPGCEQPVRVRAGRVKRWHFAHKHLENCPYARESAQLLGARAVLYHGLIQKFDVDQVHIEKQLNDPNLPRYVDCWVETPEHKFAYWIIDRRLPPKERVALLAGSKSASVPFHWIFTAGMRREDQFLRHHLHLTTTEREFMNQSDYDGAWQTHFAELGKTLHYLDETDEILTTYRNLFLRHRPQVFSGTPIATHISDLEISLETGEFTHPGEQLKLSEKKHHQAIQQAQVEKRLHFAEQFFNRISGSTQSPPEKNKIFQDELSKSAQQTTRQPFSREVPCRVCGIITANWVNYDGQTKTCLCRDCNSAVTE